MNSDRESYLREQGSPVPVLTGGANLMIISRNNQLPAAELLLALGASPAPQGAPLVSCTSTCFIPEDDSLWRRFLGRDKAPRSISALPFPAECQAGVMLGKGIDVQVWPPKSIAEIQVPFQKWQELFGSPEVPRSQISWFWGRNQAPSYSYGSEPLPAKNLVPDSSPGIPNTRLRFQML